MMRLNRLAWACLVGLPALTPAWADDNDALALESAPSTPAAPATAALRVVLEAGAGLVENRNGASNQGAHREALDLRYAGTPAAGWRVTFSDRLDDVHPVLEGQKTTLNSLRELALGWQSDDAATTAELGRVNLRHGPALGFNPTDYFRSGALRTVTTADPIALRANRMGTGMLRLGRQWEGTGVSLALAPKLASAPDAGGAAVDFGATNNRSRALLTASARLSDRLSGQFLVLGTAHASTRVGFNLTALAGDALVAYAEYSRGNDTSLADALAGSTRTQTQQQAALGLTYTFPSKLALTIEAEYNSRGLGQGEFANILAQGGYANYLALTQPSLELGSRRAWMVYATQKDIGIKQLDFTALARANTVDHSTLAWAELRYHWPRFDAALQWQRGFGSASSEFGAMPIKQVVQAVGYWYF